ncbi:UPF0715 family protein [Bacillus sp. YC2]|uniref:UPF0715 family protein n=1 Tax=Bacillus sp. YC2 TaxID=2861287 RepID=UPI001CA6F75F|nr:UPF0715 family protein [Bacillus sp. YC2]MBY8914436.1 UPF0715 family protein [Bacillus sp. YC2]
MRALSYLSVLVMSAICAALVYVNSVDYDDDYIPYFIICVILLIFYFVFALPVQLFLNRNPKKFNLRYLLIYIFFSFSVWFVFAVLTDLHNYKETLKSHEIYLFSISFALIFWVWDSVFVQKATVKKNEQL